MEKSSTVKERIRQLKKEIEEAPHWGAAVSVKNEELQGLLRAYPNLDPIQDNCRHGFVLPDRCVYNPIVGCKCGAYPALKWNPFKNVFE